MKNRLPVIVMALFGLLGASSGSGCDVPAPSSADIQAQRQELSLKEATAENGIPAIKNFREQRLLKQIYELRDQEGLVTYTYLFSDYQGKPHFLCRSIGYAVPYSTQYTAPEHVQRYRVLREDSKDSFDYGTEKLPQAEPNGLYPPTTSEGTWVLCLDPSGKLMMSGKRVLPVYIEPRIIVSPFKLAE